MKTDQSVREALTPREWRVAQLVHLQLSNKQIASDMGISDGTVKTHLERMRAKLRVPSRVGIALLMERFFVDEERKKKSVSPKRRMPKGVCRKTFCVPATTAGG